jgi:hypothetical protein
MLRQSSRRSRSLAQHSLDLSIAAPQVIAHRFARWAQAGATPTTRDLAEFQRMAAEKVTSFGTAWQAMGLAAVRAQQSYLQALTRSMLTPWWIAPPDLGALARRANAVTVDVLAAGIAPIRHKAVGNARRLARRRRR